MEVSSLGRDCIRPIYRSLGAKRYPQAATTAAAAATTTTTTTRRNRFKIHDIRIQIYTSVNPPLQYIYVCVCVCACVSACVRVCARARICVCTSLSKAHLTKTGLKCYHAMHTLL